MATLPDRAGLGGFATRASAQSHKQHGFRPAMAGPPVHFDHNKSQGYFMGQDTEAPLARCTGFSF